MDDLKEGRICESCNNGWMSALEQAAQPVLMPLIDGSRKVLELLSREREIVARWAAKTAYVLNSGSNYHKNVPEDHFRFMYAAQDALPAHTIVVAQQHQPTEKFYWMQQYSWVTHSSTDNLVTESELATLSSNSYKISIQIGHLLLLVAWWPHEAWRYVLWWQVHIPLWPSRGPVVWSYKAPEAFPWNNSIEAQAAFHISLGLAKGENATR